MSVTDVVAAMFIVLMVLDVLGVIEVERRGGR